MRARAIREGSVGLLILIAVGLFAGLVLWLRGLNPGKQTYRATIVFDNTLGMQEGTSVRYRGVPVGQVLRIMPTTNAVDVAVEIGSSELRIPRDAVVMVNQSGLIGDTTIDITPQRRLSEQELAVDPRGKSCLGQMVICDGDRLNGQVGASYESLLLSAERLANAFADPELIADLKVTLNNATTLTESASLLSTELIVLSRQLQTDLRPLMASANRATDNVSSAAAQFQITGTELNRLVVTNRGTLVNTLSNLDRSATQIQSITTTLSPAFQEGQFIANLERLSADAAVAAADIRSITGTFNSAENLVMLQQTLDSARNVFQSAHKVMADVDELTGDPVLRRNLRDLINGLNSLVSLTNQLEQASQVAGSLTPAAGAQVERVTFTPIPAPPPPTGTGPTPVTITHQGQTYRLDVHSIQPR
ncbi:MCE family protein [Phormidium sp. FACHB-322]|uniref:MlaD family protein n=1 Tax=unclassified Leptolyngbya TaxID=2650499 RepID=UPI001688ED71|nr:MlaD family protein [Leptolyngbya sp. FACHB-60]MBD1917775.1 MCE family protein [Phormidium sp. FACHB-77]MBD2032893.1 MCE family protein [Phormidium sp. FACHB-322]MBD2051641.1 MCE family protein [Leptolyngbya sp. FACHB-60]